LVKLTRQWIAAFSLMLVLCGPALGQASRPAEPASRAVGSGREDQAGQGDDRRVGDGGGPSIWPWVQTVGALAVVVGLIFALRHVLRRLGPVGAIRRGAGPVEVIMRSNLSPRERVYLVRMGERVLLVGSGPAGLTTLCEVSDAEEAARLLASGSAATSAESAVEGSAAGGKGGGE